MSTNFVSSYLERIGYIGPTVPCVDVLTALHKAHLYTVPFENLDIHLHRPILLIVENLYDKIVVRKRGGFCYELNGLFAALLHELGFRVDMLSAGVAREDGGFDPPFDHMLLMVHLEERWLADVGFGDNFLEPLRFDERAEQIQNGDSYRVDAVDGEFVLMRRVGAWKPQYKFTSQPYPFADYEPMCRHHQTSPASHFTRKRVCSLPTQEGRITLSDRKLITTVRGNRTERILESDEEYSTALKQHFGVVLQ